VIQLLSPRTLEQLALLDIHARQAAGGRGLGERVSGAAGIGTIFREHRTYTPGDDMRYVDWNVYRRHGSFSVKVFEHEEKLDVHLIVDRTASMGSGPGSKLMAACRVAAMVGASALARGATVRLQLLPAPDRSDGGGQRVFQGRGATRALIQRLASVQPGAQRPLGEVLREAFPRLRRRGFALLLTDFLDAHDATHRGMRRAIDFLVHRRVEATAIHVVSPEERDPPWDGPLRLTDVETGEMLDMTVDAVVRDEYRQRFEHRIRAVRAYLRSKEVRHVRLDSGIVRESVVLRLLLRERVLR
jgi:uncharacterized protein (DUF58 family)